jgi:hypothetical protein
MKKSITTVSIILLTLVLSACDSKEKSIYQRVQKVWQISLFVAAYDKLNDDATKMYGKEWEQILLYYKMNAFFMLFKKQQCSANKAQVASMFVLYSFNIMLCETRATSSRFLLWKLLKFKYAIDV